MKNDLKDLRQILNDGIYGGEKFTKQHKQEVLRKAKKTERNYGWFPRTMTAVFIVCFLGLSTYLVNDLTSSPASSDKSSGSNDESLSVADTQLQENQIPYIFNFPANTPIELTEEFKENMSIPLNLRDILPEVKSKPFLLATTLKEGYRISASYPMEDYSIELIESVEPKERIAEELANHREIAPDQQELQIDGHLAFYSEAQKEMHIFTETRYFTIYGAEKDLLMEIANLIDLDKPLAPIELQEFTIAKMDPVDLSEIEVQNYIPSNFHENTEFLKDSKPPTLVVLQGKEGSSIINNYQSPISSTTVYVEQMYTVSGENKIANQIIMANDIIRTVELEDHTILLMTDSENYRGYFEKGKYSFFVTGNKDSITIENIEEILKAIKIP